MSGFSTGEYALVEPVELSNTLPTMKIKSFQVGIRRGRSAIFTRWCMRTRSPFNGGMYSQKRSDPQTAIVPAACKRPLFDQRPAVITLPPYPATRAASRNRRLQWSNLSRQGSFLQRINPTMSLWS